MHATAMTPPNGFLPTNSTQIDVTFVPQSGSLSDAFTSSSQLVRLPSQTNLVSYTNQVGGHGEFVKHEDPRMLLKPFDSYEFSFYRQLHSSRFKDLLPFTARCFGEVEVDSSRGSGSNQAYRCTKYVMLEDLAHGLSAPCILDLKMGLKQRSLKNVSAMKLRRTSTKSLSTTSHSLGFRLCGALYYDAKGNRIFRDKYEGRNLDETGAFNAISDFFSSVSDESMKFNLIASLIARLEKLLKVIGELSGVRFWSGSLLLVFDAQNPEAVTMKMIDFVQTAILGKMDDMDEDDKLERSATLPDLEYLYGIQNLLAYLHAIRDGSLMPPAVIGPAPDAADQDEELLRVADKSSEQ